MEAKRFLDRFSIPKKSLAVFILLSNTFVWWYMTLLVLDIVVRQLEATSLETLVLWAFYDVVVVVSSVIGFLLVQQVTESKLLILWIMLGIGSSLLPVLFCNFTIIYAFVIFLTLGFSFGLGMPVCMTWFADHAAIEKRGRLAGFIFLFANLVAPIFSISFGTYDPVANSIISAIWRGVGLIVFWSLRHEKRMTKNSKKAYSLFSVFRNRVFVLYLVAWLLFCLIDKLEVPILKSYFGSEAWNFRILIGPIASSLSALLGGILCDWIGRKRMVIYSFLMLGVAYALIGIAPTVTIFWYLHSLIDGITWGVFLVIFILVIWGDISQTDAREKYYVMGSIPFFITDFIQLLSASHVEAIPIHAAFSLASFFLFLAVLPLLYAPETLPEKQIELRRLRRYMEKAKEVREKYQGTSDKA